MSYIVFVSTFPNEANMRDGYYRRVHHVDQAMENSTRIHLDIRFARNFRKRIQDQDDRMKVMHLNTFLHFFLIFKVLQNAGIIYVHAISKVPSIILQLNILKGKVPIAIDLHGVMVDELRLAGNPLKAWFYSIIEKFCFRYSNLNVYVSEVMRNHFHQKYPDFKGNDVIFAANSITTNASSAELSSPRTRGPRPSPRNLAQDLGILPSDTLFLYSGNTQAWQNVDLMLSTIKNLTAPNYAFLILSGQKKIFEEKMKQSGLSNHRIQVLSVQPDELGNYYDLAHYGFILRDDILVNRVANPTKLAEYLQYGMIPVVKLVEIGDYAGMGYEYLRIEDCKDSLAPIKSETNREIYREMTSKYGSEALNRSLSETISHSQQSL